MLDIDLEVEFGQDEEVKDKASLEDLIALGQEMVQLESTASELEEALAGVKSKLNHIKTSVLPDAMASLGLSRFRLEDGTELIAEDFVAGSLPKDPLRKEAAIFHLESHGGAGLIKSQVSLSFGRADYEKAVDSIQFLKNSGFNPVMETTVHPQTLCAYARELLAKGDEFDPAILGLFVGRKVKVKINKK